MASASQPSSRQGSWLKEAFLLALLPAVVSCVMLWPALSRQGVLAPTDIVAADSLIGGRLPTQPAPATENPLLGDVIDAFIPWKMYARSELASGRFPLWNPYNLLGTHFHANLQSQIFSPFNLIWLALPPLWGLSVVAALKWTVCGLGMGLLLRALGLGMVPALFGSVALQLSGPVAGWLQWPISEGLAWVPWMLWAALKWVDTLSLRWLAALTAFVAAELLASHIETSFHSLAFLALFALAAWASAPLAGRARLGALGGLVVAGLLGVAVCAVQLLPFLDVLTSTWQWSMRAAARSHVVPLPPEAGLMWLTPNGFGWPDAYDGPFNWVEANPYVGALTLLLAAWSLAVAAQGMRARYRASQPQPRLAAGRERTWPGLRSALSPRQPIFWAGMTIIALSMAYGLPPLAILRELPGFSSSNNWRLVSVAGPPLVVLGAMGLQHLLSIRRRALSPAWGLAAAIFGLASALFLVTGAGIWVIDSKESGDYMVAWRAWGGALFAAGAALIFARLVGWIPPRAFALLALGLLLVDMMRADWNFNAASPYETFYPVNRLTKFLVELGPGERVAVVGRYAESNMLLYYRIADYRIYDPTVSERYMVYTRSLSPETYRTAFREQDASYTVHLFLIRPDASQLSALGIRWLVSDDGEDPNSWQPAPDGTPFYERRLESHGFIVWENRYARPYAYLASRFQVSPDDATVLVRMKFLSPEKGNIVLALNTEGTLPPDSIMEPGPHSPTERVALDSYVPGEIKIEVAADRARLVVVNESWSPGWRAEVDGSPATIHRINYVVQGVVVPKGEHHVRLVYDPPAFRWGIGISVVALIAWLGLLGYSMRRSSKRRASMGDLGGE